MNVTKPRRTRRTRRTHTEDFKRSLIEACGEPLASVAGVALANGINANQLRRWMRERGIKPPELSSLPARPVADVAAGFVPLQIPAASEDTLRRPAHSGLARGECAVADLLMFPGVTYRNEKPEAP